MIETRSRSIEKLESDKQVIVAEYEAKITLAEEKLARAEEKLKWSKVLSKEK